jgi:hypothetical protein
MGQNVRRERSAQEVWLERLMTVILGLSGPELQNVKDKSIQRYGAHASSRSIVEGEFLDEKLRGRREALKKLREQRRRLDIQGVSPGLFSGTAPACSGTEHWTNENFWMPQANIPFFNPRLTMEGV